uniref:Uncharacterized protein n=1 Tax=Peronospora matthiolae TaxID=2874970 RepID=A0AAV1TQJ7_9STRA
MGIELGAIGSYRRYREEAIGDLLRANGLTDANPTRSPTGDDWYDETDSDLTHLRRSR